MPVAATFKASLYTLVCLAALILGRAEMGPIPFITVAITLLSFWLTERVRPLAIGVVAANIAGICAFVVAAIEFVGPADDAKLLAGAHLVVYITWIVLLQHKTDRQYWSLSALALLQVAVASVLVSNGDSWYGASAILYSAAAIWTLAVFSLFQADRQFNAAASERGSGEGTSTVSSANSFSGHGLAPSASSAVQSAFRHEGATQWINLRFISGVGSLVLFSLLVSAGFFLLTPRVWLGNRMAMAGSDGPISGARSVTGFAKTVRLGDIGEILESIEPVLDVRLFDVESEAEIDVEHYTERLGYSEPLFRGLALSIYESGQWKSDTNPGAPQPIVKQSYKAAVHQEIRLNDGTGVNLFVLGYPLAANTDLTRSDLKVYRQLRTRALLKDPSDSESSALTYSVYGPAMPDRVQQFPGIPLELRENRDYESSRYRALNLELPRNDLGPLMAMAEQVIAARRLRGAGDSQVERARELEQFLRDSGEFRYSLSSKMIDKTIDPVVDFLINRKEGHCEFFNSALTLMLRAQKIPARLVSGYKGGQLNSLTGRFEVQQRHSHVWVEALVKLPDESTRWLVLDATPAAARNESVNSMVDHRTYWERLSSDLGGIWSRYVVNVNLEQQKETMYTPIVDLWGQIVEPFRAAWRNLWVLLGFWTESADDSLAHASRRWQSFWAVSVLAAGAASLLWLFRRYRGSFANYEWPWKRRRRQRRIVVAFYERFATLAKKSGVIRSPHQTQMELASAFTERWRDKLRGTGLDDLPEQIAALFYSVRFGGSELDSAQIEGLQARLKSLEQFVQVRRQARS